MLCAMPSVTKANEALSPMPQSITQSTPDYIAQAQARVKKYYPQYVEYFVPIFIAIRGTWKEISSLINKKIHENLEIFSEDIKSEIDKSTIILIALEQFTWANSFCKMEDVEIIDQNEWYDIRAWIASEITFDINAQVQKSLNDSRKKLNRAIERSNKLVEDINKFERKKTSTSPDGLINDVEALYEIIDVDWLKDLPTIQNIVSSYKNICKMMNRKPSQKWEVFITEYERIHK